MSKISALIEHEKVRWKMTDVYDERAAVSATKVDLWADHRDVSTRLSLRVLYTLVNVCND